MRLPDPPLLAILAPGPPDPLELAHAFLSAGGRWLSLRAKELPAEEQLGLLRALAPLAEAAEARLSLHGEAALAAAAGLSAVHLSRDGNVRGARAALGSHALIGISTHDRDELDRAAASGADYVTLSPIFPSISKPGHGGPEGLALLQELASTTPLPVIALGGITPERVRTCLAAGASGVAVLGGLQTEDPAKRVAAYLAALGSAFRPL